MYLTSACRFLQESAIPVMFALQSIATLMSGPSLVAWLSVPWRDRHGPDLLEAFAATPSSIYGLMLALSSPQRSLHLPSPPRGNSRGGGAWRGLQSPQLSDEVARRSSYPLSLAFSPPRHLSVRFVATQLPA